MPTPRTEHRAKIAEARNVLGEVISRARYADEPTVLVNRGKEAAVIVSHPFYEQALRDRALIELLERRAQRTADGAPAVTHARVLREELDMAERDIQAAKNIAES
ncbi:type II toxin-antitoxin system prevent-host-death family antitoxin [Streptomyces iakyrus]|uniref:type II toxin-antitoxin system prevent-host-death family antitoxin n=1 Tax=Streptomyces iakyrus TaxID=68219 RepID=UPI0005276426|nr:type II toxin-antitoxin system prevent-host-death family antitoxin [Streptomyces iakyrus]